jgi:anti-sigma factor RsiW
MLPRKAKAPGAPSPEELAAFADGELDRQSRARVQAWLLSHPEASAEVDATLRLDRLHQATAADDPGESTWAGVLRRIETRAAEQRRSAAGLLPRLARIFLPLAGAAAVLLALWLVQRDHGPMPASSTAAVEPFPVVSADDIEIVSLDDADRRALVVGKPPLDEPMVLVAAGDTSEIKIEPDVDGMKPSIARPMAGATMIVVPLAVGVDEKDE